MEREQWKNVRGLAIFGVIVTHVMTMKFDSSSVLNNSIILIFDQLSRFSVPVFIMSSGYGLRLNYTEKIRLNTFYKRRFKIIPEYIFWSIVYFLLREDHKNLKSLVFDLLTGKSSEQLYFIIVLIQLYLLFPFIVRFSTEKIGILTAFLITLIGQLFYQAALGNSNTFFVNWYFYFVFGIYLAGNKNFLNKIKKYSQRLFFLGTLFMLGSAFINVYFSERSIGLSTSTMRPTMIFYSIGILSFFLSKWGKPKKILSMLDESSLSIFYVHIIFLILYYRLFKFFHIEISNFIVLVILVILVTISSLVFSKYYKKYIEKYFY
ncbi:acyltransferase [Enterococcus sp. DIV0756]|uniref:acyltransferase n=1 Tax=Enterococcus sp. DIV0756 TaxID=2774636 RepID=UPI003F25789D